ncbi:MAG TPA: hypothetical protein PKK11_02655 [Methanothrix sp.]|nr:hypothetical protein [Methanothrix sp.]HPT19155.1 hypothetical protein [Methanothrix sp.]
MTGGNSGSSTPLQPCPTCFGRGKVVAGYAAVCTEIVERLERCPECGGKGRRPGHRGP